MVVKVTVSLPSELAEFIDRVAAETHRSRSGVVADLLQELKKRRLKAALAEGYRELAEENKRFAREAMPLAGEVWEQQ
ncbi:MAG: ribbon-helix-helix protein, CopG family [Chloroflexi bacterium]|nr:ribbon-helix-helix protein, CopG family [Chloroflexota bacterium]